MNRIAQGVIAGLLVVAVTLAIEFAVNGKLANAQQPQPNGVQYLQGRVADDALTIARLFDETTALRAEIVKLKEKPAPACTAPPL